MRYNFNYMVLLALYMLIVVTGCQKTQQIDQTIQMQVSHSVELGKKLSALVKDKRHEEAVIELRNSLNGLYEKECEKSFTEAGVTKKDWNLLLNAAKSSEFEAGKNYGTKLRANRLQDADVVEYIKGTLRNAPDFKKLAFSAGFVSVFKDHKRGRDHLDTLWIWAMSP